MEKIDCHRTGWRPGRGRVMFLFCFPPNTQHPNFLFLSCREKNPIHQRALHPPVLATHRVFYKISVPAGAEIVYANYQPGLWMFVGQICPTTWKINVDLQSLHTEELGPLPDSQLVSEQGSGWEQLSENAISDT